MNILEANICKNSYFYKVFKMLNVLEKPFKSYLSSSSNFLDDVTESFYLSTGCVSSRQSIEISDHAKEMIHKVIGYKPKLTEFVKNRIYTYDLVENIKSQEGISVGGFAGIGSDFRYKAYVSKNSGKIFEDIEIIAAQEVGHKIFIDLNNICPKDKRKILISYVIQNNEVFGDAISLQINPYEYIGFSLWTLFDSYGFLGGSFDSSYKKIADITEISLMNTLKKFGNPNKGLVFDQVYTKRFASTLYNEIGKKNGFASFELFRKDGFVNFFKQILGSPERANDIVNYFVRTLQANFLKNARYFFRNPEARGILK